MQYLQMPGDGSILDVNRVMNGSQLPCWYWNSNPSSLQGQQMLITGIPLSLKSLHSNLNGELDSGPHACLASTLPSEAPPRDFEKPCKPSDVLPGEFIRQLRGSIELRRKARLSWSFLPGFKMKKVSSGPWLAVGGMGNLQGYLSVNIIGKSGRSVMWTRDDELDFTPCFIDFSFESKTQA